jgi:hypothetical protein
VPALRGRHAACHGATDQTCCPSAEDEGDSSDLTAGIYCVKEHGNDGAKRARSECSE